MLQQECKASSRGGSIPTMVEVVYGLIAACAGDRVAGLRRKNRLTVWTVPAGKRNPIAPVVAFALKGSFDVVGKNISALLPLESELLGPSLLQNTLPVSLSIRPKSPQYC